MRIMYIRESRETLHGVDTEECNLSYKEQIEKAKKDCVERVVCSTMSPIYLQAFKLYADIFDVLDQWKFIILKDDGTSVDVTDNTEDAFAMMVKPLDDLFNIEIGGLRTMTETVTIEKRVFDVMQKNNLDLMDKLEEAKKALRFYAYEDAHKCYQDNGEIARACLKEIE